MRLYHVLVLFLELFEVHVLDASHKRTPQSVAKATQPEPAFGAGEGNAYPNEPSVARAEHHAAYQRRQAGIEGVVGRKKNKGGYHGYESVSGAKSQS
jgi:hypothetical protein